LGPEAVRDQHRVDADSFSPIEFNADSVRLAMMDPAKGTANSSLTLSPTPRGLRKTQMMRIRKLPSADQTGLLNNKLQMGSVALLTGRPSYSLSEVSPGEK
jgi:hypothetical protein